MVSLETVQASSKCIEPNSSPRISFSADFLDENNFISICPNPQADKKEREKTFNAEFEFLSGNLTSQNMITADELFCEGKLLPFWQMHHSEKLNKISLKTDNAEGETDGKETNNKEDTRISWFLDDDPSPRPPKLPKGEGVDQNYRSSNELKRVAKNEPTTNLLRTA
ncbi:hypothetical protein Fot_53598 [Forsythia ovata]|uniref:Uncharacterized protein n=1 Tax=Forsythia ovata TaxID=205694 RepID=A0ABD1PJV0_9LAMI